MSDAVIVPVVGSVDELGYFNGAASVGDRLYLAGYYPYDTRGGGLLYWDGDTTSAADDFMIFLDNAYPKRRWKRVPGLGPIDAHMAGAHGDGVINSSGWVDRTAGHDDTAAIQKTGFRDSIPIHLRVIPLFSPHLLQRNQRPSIFFTPTYPPPSNLPHTLCIPAGGEGVGSNA